jgi:hypothetical protein
MFEMRVLAMAIVFLALTSPAVGRPVNLDEPIIDTNGPYLENVRILQSLRRQGYLTPELASSQMYPTLEQALTALRTSRVASSIHPRDVADELEANWVWWTNARGGARSGGQPYPVDFYLHNRTNRVISGVVVEMADRGCDFRASAAKAFHIISFGSNGTLRPNDASLYQSSIPTRAGMFANSGGSWCMTIVRAY